MDAIRIAMQEMYEGQTRRDIMCPFCGDTTGAFSVTRTVDKVLFHCFRASCGASGFVQSDGPPKVTSTSGTKKTAKKLTIDIYPIEAWEWRGIYDIEKEIIGSHYGKDKYGRVVVSLYDKHMRLVGMHAKRDAVLECSYTGPKAVTYKLDEGPYYFYLRRGDGSFPLVIVEDIFSAGVFNTAGYASLALLGTSASHDMLKEIKFLSRNTDKILVALDPDAITKGIMLKEKLNSLMPGKQVGVAWLDKDPKFYNRKEIVEIVETHLV